MRPDYELDREAPFSQRRGQVFTWLALTPFARATRAIETPAPIVALTIRRRSCLDRLTRFSVARSGVGSAVIPTRLEPHPCYS